MRIPHRLFFSGESKGWGGGGVALVDPAPFDLVTLARAYLITEQQFQDVLAQESGRAEGSDVDLSTARTAGRARLGDGNYDLVIHLGDAGGWPMFTFTTPHPLDGHPHNEPGVAYRDTVIAGLMEAHDLSATEAATYVATWSTPVA